MTSGGSVRERDAGEFAAEVGGVALAVFGVVQDGVDVVEDVPLGDGGVVVVGAELFEGPVGDVLAAVGAVFGVGVERRRNGCPRHSMMGLDVSTTVLHWQAIPMERFLRNKLPGGKFDGVDSERSALMSKIRGKGKPINRRMLSDGTGSIQDSWLEPTP